MTNTRTRASFLPVVIATVLALGAIGGAQQRPADGSAEDRAAITRLVNAFAESFSKHDAHAITQTFTPDGDFTNMTGLHVRGHDAIQQRFTTIFKGRNRNAHRTDTVKAIRFYTPEIAMVDADTVITGTLGPDGTSVLPPRHGLMIVVVTKQNGRWAISNFHEAEFEEPAPPRR
jgi:uncharacterized protein (TIGR02246 family)